ncbi:amidohydrolase [Myxococcota bacterium]|nr:amidohydrolase [Myxococcota bacterium]
MSSNSPYLIISSDSHAGLPLEQYREWLDPKYRTAFDEQLPEELAFRKWEVDTFLDKDFEREWKQGRVPEGIRGAWDSAERNRQLDADGIAGEVIFPDGVTEMNTPPFKAGFTLPVGEGIDPELQWAGARAHNRWVSEFCRERSERRAGIAVVPILYDIDDAVHEIRWAADAGLRGIVIPALFGDHPPYHHERYAPIWATCEDLGLVIHTHGGAAPDYGPFDDPGTMGIYMTEFAWWAWRPTWFLIWGGVFERHPRLQYVVTELGAIWAPLIKSVMDHRFETNHITAKLGDYSGGLRMKPSEYFDRNVSVGSSFAPRSDVEARHQIGIGNIMWGHDYPHPEGLWPKTSDFLRNSFHDVPDDERRRMLGGNAIDVYRFDEPKLRALADQIGPGVDLF